MSIFTNKMDKTSLNYSQRRMRRCIGDGYMDEIQDVALSSVEDSYS